MAGELQAYTTTGLTLYAVLINSIGQAWNTAGTPAFETIEADNWTDYDIAMVESEAPGVYLGDMPGVIAGMYTYLVYSRAGANPATTDTLKGTGFLAWDGSAEISVATLNDLSAADVNAEVVDALATDVIADSIPADGDRGSIAQSVYMILQLLTEGAISGTTWTVKKVDGSTTLFTITLDDGTTPTSKTRSA